MVSKQGPKSARSHLGKTAPLFAVPKTAEVIGRPRVNRTDRQFAIPEAMGPDRLTSIIPTDQKPEPRDADVIDSPTSTVIPDNVMDVGARFLSARVIDCPDNRSVLITFDGGKTVNIPVPKDSVVKLPSPIPMSFSVDGLSGLASAITRFCKGKLIQRVTILPSGTKDYNGLMISAEKAGIFMVMVSPPPGKSPAVDLPKTLMAKFASCTYRGDNVKMVLDDGRIIDMQVGASAIALSSSSSLSRHIISDVLASKEVDGASGLAMEIEKRCKGQTIVSIQNDKSLYGGTQISIRLENEGLYSTVIVKTDTPITLCLTTSG